MLEDLIKNSLFLNEKQKKYFSDIINTKNQKYIEKIEEYFKEEKYFLIQSLKEYKNRNNTDIWMIKQEIIQKNLKRIKKLELEEQSNDNLYIWLDNIF